MSGFGSINLKVAIVDSDYYAMQAINGYLAWDRRTRVTYASTSMTAFWQYLAEIAQAELPDVVLIDVDHLGNLEEVQATISHTLQLTSGALIVCMAQRIDNDLLQATADSGARAYLLKEEVRMQIAWAIVYALDHDFVVTASVARAARGNHHKRIYHASLLPEQRIYPEMTDRIRQAIRLCVIEGMPAHLAADEMGISLHTIRGYIKEGYRILESYDQYEYPLDMTPQERAFMRFTALANDQEVD
jgi:DNA-binding NarL/FixJ family response regulator